MSFGLQVFDDQGRKAFDSNEGGVVVQGKLTIPKATVSGYFNILRPAGVSGKLFAMPVITSLNWSGPAIWVVQPDRVYWDYKLAYFPPSVGQRAGVDVHYGWY